MLHGSSHRGLLRFLYLKKIVRTIRWKMNVTVVHQIHMRILILGSITLLYRVYRMERWNRLDSLAAFIKELEGLSNMTGPDISDIIDDLPIPQQQEVESMSVHDAVQV
jgi:hypothetical protein